MEPVVFELAVISVAESGEVVIALIDGGATVQQAVGLFRCTPDTAWQTFKALGSVLKSLQS